MNNSASFYLVMICVTIFIVSCTDNSTSSLTTDAEAQVLIVPTQTPTPIAVLTSVTITSPSQSQITTVPKNRLKQSPIVIATTSQTEITPPMSLPIGMMLKYRENFADTYGVDPLNIQKTDDSYIYFFDTKPVPITVSIPRSRLTSSFDHGNYISLERMSKTEKDKGKNTLEYTFDFGLDDFEKSKDGMISPIPKNISITIPNNELTVISTTAYKYVPESEIQYIDYDLDVVIKKTTASYTELEFTTHTQDVLSIAFLNNLWESEPATYEILNDIIQWTYPEKIDLIEDQFRSFQFKTTRSTQDIGLNNSSFWHIAMMLDSNKISRSIKQDYESIINLKFDTDNFSSQNTNIELTCDAEPYIAGTDAIIDLVNAGPNEIVISGNSSILLTADFLKKYYSFIPVDDLFPQENLKLYGLWSNYERNYDVAYKPKEERDLIFIHLFDDFIPLECEMSPLKICLNSNPHIIYGTEAMHGDEITVYLDGHFVANFAADSMGNWGPYYLTQGCEGQEIAFSLNGELIDITQDWLQGGMPVDPVTGFILEPY